ncbi:hypothetical protein EVAR_10711_1 [Eumeta japonica]|uniref:Uncharacterized protein n=1 Tax=Eumeta variegata TaxID=151549 RepID=A0A4C1U7A3_EUMVA|nr:hypothetical protein EVAR_10711_1 [Eumeta japonica]
MKIKIKCCARGRPIIVEWERDARHSAGLSLVRAHRFLAPVNTSSLLTGAFYKGLISLGTSVSGTKSPSPDSKKDSIYPTSDQGFGTTERCVFRGTARNVLDDFFMVSRSVILTSCIKTSAPAYERVLFSVGSTFSVQPTPHSPPSLDMSRYPESFYGRVRTSFSLEEAKKISATFGRRRALSRMNNALVRVYICDALIWRLTTNRRSTDFRSSWKSDRG